MTISNDQTAELYRTLGRVEQGIDDIRSMLASNNDAIHNLGKRVGSLERSRTASKAWLAGMMACASAVGALGAALFHIGKP